MSDFEALLRASITLPQSVVLRRFAEETVLLNVNECRFWGLNIVGGRMLEELQRHGDVRRAVDAVAAEYDVPKERVQHDFAALVDQLAERGLIEVDLLHT